MPKTNGRKGAAAAAAVESTFAPPGLDVGASRDAAAILAERLVALMDLGLTLKHVHWNVVGPHFIGVHRMIDPHVDEVHAMIDATAERIAILGASPDGRPGSLVARRTWDDYSLRRATADEHLAALDRVYDGLLTDHRAAIAEAGEVDPVTEDLLIQQMHQLELFHWFVRAHLEDPEGHLATVGTSTEAAAARSVRGRTRS